VSAGADRRPEHLIAVVGLGAGLAVERDNALDQRAGCSLEGCGTKPGRATCRRALQHSAAASPVSTFFKGFRRGPGGEDPFSVAWEIPGRSGWSR